MTINVLGLKTQYQKIGKGQVVVLLHGWGCDWQIWYPLIQPLSKQFTLIIPDLPAFGQSDNPPEVWNSFHYQTWFQAFCDQVVKTKQFAVVGHSFGGKIASLFASQNLETLSHLILIDASGLPDPLSSWKRTQKQLLGFVPTPLKSWLPKRVKQTLLQATGSASDHFQATEAQRAILKIIVSENISEELLKIKTPTLVLWGENDLETPLHQGQLFAKLIPGAILKVMPNVGHFPFLDQPTQSVSIIQDFLCKK